MTAHNPNGLIDTRNRPINYLRISITDRCNLQCLYCSPRRPFRHLAHRAILRYEEILQIAEAGVKLGITKIRVTGGEPFVRKNTIGFLAQLAGLPGLQELTLTTNGVLLAPHLDELSDMGVRRLNISLDTLDAEKYKKITGRNAFGRVWDAIESALAKGFFPIKINVVALAGINAGELADLAALTRTYPFHVRFIEQMPFGGVKTQKTPPLLEPEIRARIAALGDLHPVDRDKNDGPARRYRLAGAPGEIGFISAVSHHFCNECNRLRLTADG
ncbi:MAG: GTP 3',8-cyclase MoaA, partial [Thermodesulfobacteriota bacterium]